MARGYGEPMGNEYGSDNNRDRWRDDDRERSSWRSGEQRPREGDDERGFFERAGEEIRSWFSDEDDNRGSARDYERSSSGGGSSWDRDNYNRSGSQGGGWSGGSSWDRDRSGGISDRDRERSYGRIGRGGSDYMSQDRTGFGGRGQGGMGRSGGGSGWEGQRERGFGPSRGGGYWSSPDRGDHGHMGGFEQSQSISSQRHGSGREHGFGGFRDESDFRGEHRSHPQSWGQANRGQSNWNRDRGQNEGSDRDRSRSQSDTHLGYGDFSGTLGGFGNQTFGSSQDDHYRSWRDRQMNQLDQDYSDYCSERQQQFHSDFDSWRRNRQNQPQGQRQDPDELALGTSSLAPTAGVSSSGTATGSSGESSAVGGGSLTGDSSGQADTTKETASAGSGVSGRSRNRS
jgi:hypothetical protein